MHPSADPTAAPVSRRVTDPALDAPDGAKLAFPDGFIYERVAGEWVPVTSRCTGVTASWCPTHGDCTCATGPDGLPTLDDTDCALHDPGGAHGDWFDGAPVAAPSEG